MKTTSIKKIWREGKDLVDSDILISGWVRTSRTSKTFGFIELNDGTFFKNIQIVFNDNLDNFNELAKISLGSSLIVNGKLVESPGDKQPYEIHATNIEIAGICDPDFPLQKKRHSREYLRTIAHLRPRTNLFTAVFRVRSLIAYAIHKFFNEGGFVYVHTPIITSSDAEGAGEMFRVSTLDPEKLPKTEKGEVDYSKDFFGKSTNLTVSGQLAVENFCAALRNVYTFGPTFRAEKSYTQTHASEFWMVEPEMAFSDLNDDMDLAEDLMKYIISYLLENAPEEMEFFNQWVDKTLMERLTNVRDSKFERITYTEAIEHLEKSGKKFEFKPEWGKDLQTEHERYLTEEVFSKPIFVTDYPKDIKAFYMRMNDDNKTVAAMDLLVPGVGEIIGGSQREERHDFLTRRIEEMGLEKEEYWWYLDLRRFGTNKHCGFGLGFERTVMYMTGVENIRDVIPFPRTPKSAEF